ncbi:precorrin-4 C(11)-methyltransferase [Corynebacterium aquilae]|uniref:Precorrin-4 C11-methyltransferase n=1 Tax=Corynebacterium aquilae DSM 44791 TaxID=1431546 RepID=A0A1L7CFV6_9CORY|nr:precorrin-4 C(11)-methyltransferase [Corynebacterium aquilae]APT84742.1 precorrin-4 C11-methyltransferase [Corynebacterium aquilae DSM 44791]
MTVFFIGAGPGAADLLTVRAARIIERAQVCMYAGSIVADDVLALCPEGAEVINTARMPLDTIVETIASAHAQGKDVARLQSGDPAVFSAVAEQARRLTALGIDYEIVPGVPSFAAAAAVLGHELTVPTVAQTVILTRVSGRASAMPEGEDLQTLSASGSATLCIHLAAHDIDRVVGELVEAYGQHCPAAVVAYASRPQEVIVRGQLADIAHRTKEAGIVRTAIIVVGPALGADGFPDSFLYSDDRPRDEHGRTLPCVH